MLQDNPGGTPKEIMRANFIFSLAIMMGTVIFLALALVVNQFMEPSSADMANILLIIVGVIAVICLINSQLIYKKRVKLIKESTSSLQQKLTDFRAVIIVYFAMCEGAALFSIIGFILTGNYIFIGISLVMFAVMLIKLPTKKRVINDLQLNWQEQGEL